MLISEGVCPEKGLPYVDQDTGSGVERRYLAKLPTPKGHAMMALPTFGEFLAGAGNPLIPRAEWGRHEFEAPAKAVPMLDQNGHGACVGYAHGGAAMVLRARSGAPFVHLASDFLYTLINGGVDMGANGGDAIQALTATGICSQSLVSGRPVRPRGVSQACVTDAARFRLRKSYRAASVEEAVTAAVMGYQLTFAVQAGGRYNTDADGTIAYLGRFLNHEQQCGEGLRVVGGKAQILGRNSWGQAFGQNGFGWFTENHLAASLASDAIWVMVEMCDDPQDPEMPKPLGSA